MEEYITEQSNYMTIDENPYYFAHYANMARHNAFLIINEIKEKVYKTKLETPEDELEKCALFTSLSNKNKKADEYVHIIKLLTEYCPFIRFYADNPQEMGNIPLKAYLDILDKIRNENNHYNYTPERKDISKIQELFVFAKEKAQKRMIEFSPEDFDHLNNSGYYAMTEDGTLTNTGIYFFLCLFLEKKHAFQFLSRIKGFKHRGQNSHRATLETFTQLCCRLPYPKLESSDVALDMLNEIARCPNALYSVLENKEKETFKAEFKSDVANSETEVPEPVMKRYDDRFPYFTLRYFDKSQALDGITSHLQLGRRVASNSHIKKISTVVRTHKILKDMRTTHQLAHFETDAANEFYTNIPVVEHYAPQYRIVGNRIGLFFDFELWGKYTVPKENVKPNAIISTYDLGALYFYNRLYKEGSATKSPKELMKNYLDNMNRLFADIKKGNIKPVNDGEKLTPLFKIKDKDDEYEARLKNLKQLSALLQEELDKQGYGIEVKNLPDVCREYLLCYKESSAKDKAKRRFKRMLRETLFALKKVERVLKQETPLPANGLKVGEMAQELARDIVFLIKPKVVNKMVKSGIDAGKEIECKQKINNMEFDVLQKMLAYYPVYKEDIESYLSGLVNATNKNAFSHPFLYKVLKGIKTCSNLNDFYKKYYSHKQRWIEGVSKSITPEILIDNEYFLKLENGNAFPRNYNGEAIFIPSGFFNKEITQAMERIGYKIKNPEKGANAAYWIKQYFEGKSQPFYNLPRYYNKSLGGEQPVYVERNKLKEQILEGDFNRLTEDEQKKRKVLAKRIRENESEILTNQTNDRVLFLMAMELIDSENPLKKSEIVSVGYNIKEGTNLLDNNNKVSWNIQGRRVVAELPIKRYGEYRRFLKDRRLENLLKYYPEGLDIQLGTLKSGEVEEKGKKYTNSNLVDELELFDLKRNELMEQVYQFEKILCTNYVDQIKTTLPDVERNKPYIEHYYCLKYAKNELKLSKEIGELENEDFKELRNKICHNQIPCTDWIMESVKANKEEPMITSRIVDVILSIYKELNNQLVIITNSK
ncbi:type VI-B CRISPR-associated RNA-guided ribonuclease Cas13b [uncultured Bacteroides sp.]|uniref:type VI-B CRISPR-associated RNA-guided ribonuclease Cas13b n=1 Tax=uncultured Bacteroides sp. TaxID=162156 RepID=UPI002AABF31E|nr:type VI-B CRISPR-associated RNA-guided ribonuclease Cas13b [uncultured Bacteroides sp.]